MDDDSPDDVALRTLPAQLFGDHGLGRDTAGEREHRARRSPPTTSASSSPPTTAAGPRRSRSPVTSTTTTSWPRSTAAFADLPAGDGRIAAHAPGACWARACEHRRRLRAGAPRDRRPGVAPRRSGPRGARRRQPRLRRRAVEPPVRRDPRAARPRLQRLLGDVGLRRRRRLVGVRRGDARARRRGAPAGAGRARSARGRRPHRRRAGDRRRLPHRRLRDGPRGHRGPHVAGSAGCWPRSARCTPSRSSSLAGSG